MQSVLRPGPHRGSVADVARWVGCAAMATAVAALLLAFTTPYMTVATLAYALLATGVFQAARRRAHVALMSAGVAIDVALVLVLELTRSAVATAASGDLEPMQMGHIAFSLVAVVLYVPTMALGYRAIRSGPAAGAGGVHRTVGRIAFLCRTVGFVLMFSLLGRVSG